MIDLEEILNAITSTTQKVIGFIPDEPDNIIHIRLDGGTRVRHFGGAYVGKPQAYIEVRNQTYDGGLADVQAIYRDLPGYHGTSILGIDLNKEVKGLGKDSKGRSGFGIELTLAEKE